MTEFESNSPKNKFAPLGPRLDIGRDQSKLSGAFSFSDSKFLASQKISFPQRLRVEVPVKATN